jgi:salicylate hydroxylase
MQLTQQQMPPQGESTGLAIEDVVLFARVLASYQNESTERVFQIYENTRRPRINAAYEETLARWENVRDKSWLEQKLVEFFTSAWLWWRRDALEANFAYDVRDAELVL